jgi:hypothetical protein
VSDQSDDDAFDQGRRAPFTMLGDWVAVSGIDPNARSLYWDVKAHVNENRGTGTAWPPRDFLALLAGDKQARTMDPYMRQLEAIDAIGAERERSVAKMRSRNLYKVHDTAPKGWDGPSSHAEVWEWLREDQEACREYYTDRKAWLKEIETAWGRVKQAEKARGAKPSAPVSKEGHRAWLKECRRLWATRRQGKPTSPRSAVQRTTDTSEGTEGDGSQNSGSAVERTTQCGAAHLGSAVDRTGTTSKGNKKKETSDVPSARSAGGVRSTSSSGSSQLEGGSGFAAAGNESSSSDQEDGKAGVPGQRQQDEPVLSREQLAAVRAVEAVLPPVLLAELPYQQFPKRNRPAVLEALESRTVEQIRQRVERRWLSYGYEPALHDDTLTNPIGAALELIAPTRYCPDLSCEDGAMIDTGTECRGCLERRASRRAARAAGQLVKNGSSAGAGSGRMPECVICQAPFPGAVPDSGECLRCEKEAAAAFEALTARLAAPEADQQAEPHEFAAESPAEVQDEPAVDEETARLRDYYAREFGTPEQVAAYCTDAPF